MSAHSEKSQNGSPVMAKKATALSILGAPLGKLSASAKQWVRDSKKAVTEQRREQLKHNAASIGFVEHEIPSVARRSCDV